MTRFFCAQLVLSALFALLAFVALGCRAGRRLEVTGHTLEMTPKRAMFTIAGIHLAQVEDTQVFVNYRRLADSNFLRWSDTEIQFFLQRPFTHAVVQLKKGRQRSALIPIWDAGYLPQPLRSSQVFNYPVLESVQYLDTRALQIRGQNLGQHYLGQWLLFNRQPGSRPLYFAPAALADYRPLLPQEVLSWSDREILLRLPQEVASGSVFLLRQNRAGQSGQPDQDRALQSSNGLYIPASPSREAQNIHAAGDISLRLSLQLPPNVLWGPESPQDGKQPQDNAVYAENPAVFANTPSAVASRFYVPVFWPRNVQNQRWQNGPAEEKSGERSGETLILPAEALTFRLLPSDQESQPAEDSWLAQPLHAEQQMLYLDFFYSAWQQEVPSRLRTQGFGAEQQKWFAARLRQNRALLASYKANATQWSAAQEPGNKRLSPYYLAQKLYQRISTEFQFPVPPAQAPQATQATQATQDSASLEGIIWSNKTQDIQDWSAFDRLADGAASLENPVTLLPEQLLLLYLAALTQQQLPARIIAGSVANISGPPRMGAHYWLEIYLPSFGWFQLDLLAEIAAHRTAAQQEGTPSNSAASQVGRQASLEYWGWLGDPQLSGQVKIAFFPLRDSWKSYDTLRRAGSAGHPLSLSWGLEVLP